MNSQEKKIFLVQQTEKLIDCVKRLEEMKNKFGENPFERRIFGNFLQHDFGAIRERLGTQLNIIKRSTMKCVFLGKTSHGKSAVINALLGDKVLPSSTGVTTCCFVHIKGCDDDHGYLMVGETRRDLDYLHSCEVTNEKGFNIKTEVELFYSKSKCELLKHDVELIDSPGLDDLEDNDKLIDKYCKDADLFVLVLDRSKGLSKSEQDFFKNVKEKVSKPNVIVLINKWDEMIDVFKKEFTEQIIDQYKKKMETVLKQSVDEFNKNVDEIKTLDVKLRAERGKYKTIVGEVEKKFECSETGEY